ncbi:hypothetical protein QCA50_000732 [Cerrena zonata]|uniref:Uncharacterized protein n=1 Tax=Cerrena zonata TaxID=2478898 RepID=A0AAW0GVH8_9APHY
MQSYSNGLNLAFSDIVHTLSPSPMPEPPLEQHPSHTEPTNILAGPSSQQMQPSSHWSGLDEPQPLSDVELHAIQTRILQFGNPQISSTLSPRENELLQMMLRLTSHASILPDPAQLTVQAETIAGLTQQRNFLLAERTEEQKRWEAERESFDRITEALISKRKAAAGTRVVDDDTQRHIARLEDDNKALKYKLNETQQRMSTLESDLNRLRPLLVMQTIVSRPDASTSLIKPLPTRRKRKPQQSTPQPDNGSTSMSFSQVTEVLTDTDINFSQASTSSRPKSHYRFTEADTSQPTVRKGKKTKTPPLPSSGTTASEGLRFKPILADARSEMLLSAAKRIGRTRTGMLAGVVRSSSPRKEGGEGEGEGK